MSGERTVVSSLDDVTSSSPGELGTPAPALVARTVEIDPARVEDLLALLPTDDPVSWVRRDEGLVGWGRAAELRTAGAARFEDAPGLFQNADASGRALEDIATPDDEGRRLLHKMADRTGLSARGYHRVLRVARTLADLAGGVVPGLDEVGAALDFRDKGTM